MKTRNKTVLIVGISAASALVVLVGVFCVLYFVCRISWFDRSGWHETQDAALQYWDYYGRPMTQWLDIDAERYYFDPTSGNMHTGWLETAQGRYYLDKDGPMHKGCLAPKRFPETGQMRSPALDFAAKTAELGILC